MGCRLSLLVLVSLVLAQRDGVAAELAGIEQIALSDDGSLALLSDDRGRVHLYDLVRKTAIRSVMAISSGNPAKPIALWPAEGWAGVSAKNAPVSVFTMRTGNAQLLSERVSATELAFSPNGRWLGVILSDGRLVIWSTKDFQPVTAFDMPGAYAVAWSNNSKLVAIASQEGELVVWYPQGSRTVMRIKSPAVVHGLFDMAFSADGRQLFAVGETQYTLMDVAGGKVARNIDPRFEGVSRRTYGVAWNATSNRAIDVTEKAFRIWNLESAEIERELPTRFTPQDVAFSRDGTKVLYRPAQQLNSSAFVYRDLGAELGWTTENASTRVGAGPTSVP